MFSCEFCKIFKNAFLQSSYGGCLWKWCHHNLAEHFEDCSKVPLNLDLHDYFWKLNLMSDICEVKSQISECNLQSNVVHHSPYHMKWIWYSLHQALGLFFFFCKFYMLSVKFNYAAPFSLLKLFQSWFHPSARSFDLLATFLLVLCAFGYLTFLPFVRETFLIPWNVKRGIFLRLLFVAVYWYLTHCFAMFLIVEVFTLIIVMSKAIACIWKSFRLVVLSCLYCSWSIFYPELIRV